MFVDVFFFYSLKWALVVSIDEANNEESDNQYAYRLRDAMVLELWDANANRRAR